jgi:hypothetical protein
LQKFFFVRHSDSFPKKSPSARIARGAVVWLTQRPKALAHRPTEVGVIEDIEEFRAKMQVADSAQHRQRKYPNHGSEGLRLS